MAKPWGFSLTIEVKNVVGIPHYKKPHPKLKISTGSLPVFRHITGIRDPVHLQEVRLTADHASRLRNLGIKVPESRTKFRIDLR